MVIYMYVHRVYTLILYQCVRHSRAPAPPLSVSLNSTRSEYILVGIPYITTSTLYNHVELYKYTLVLGWGIFLSSGGNIGLRPASAAAVSVPPLSTAAFRACMLPFTHLVLFPLGVLQCIHFRSSAHALVDMEAAMRAAKIGEASAILLQLDGSEDTNGTPPEATAHELHDDGRLMTHQLQHAALRESMRQAQVPIIAIADGPLTGAAAGLFSAASTRVCTERTTYSFCTGFGAIGVLADLPQPHVAMAVALGAFSLNAHDCTELGLAQHYAPLDALPDLLSELHASPATYYDVPVSRRTRQTPPLHLVPLYASERAAPLNAALHNIFGEANSEIHTILTRLERQHVIAADHAEALARDPCGIHVRTQERAMAVRDALQAASDALRSQPPSALMAIYQTLQAARQRHGTAAATAPSPISAASELIADSAAGSAAPVAPAGAGLASRTSKPASSAEWDSPSRLHEFDLELELQLDAHLRLLRREYL